MITERINELCEKRKMSVAELERVLGFGNSSIRKWSNQNPGIDKVEKVANYFDVSIDYLLGKSDIKNLAMETKRYEAFEKLTNADVASHLNFIVDQLGSNNYSLLFDGDELDDETRDLLLISLQNTYDLANRMRKK